MLKDAKSIETILRNTKGTWVFNDLGGCIQAGLAALWSNEGLLDALFYTQDEYRFVLLFTDKHRVVQAQESGNSISAHAIDMTGMDANKARCVEYASKSWFGKTYYHVIFEGQKNPVTFICEDKNKASAILNAVLKIIPKPAPSSPPVKTPAPSSSGTAAPSGNAAPSGTAGASAIAEIRKMYEDGLIDKAEMFDLIRSLKF